MDRKLFVFSLMIGAACVACDSNPHAPSQIPPPPPPPRFSVHQLDSDPGDGGTLAYGQAGKVLVQYTAQSGIQVPQIPFQGSTNLPPGLTAPTLYTVTSCLSADGATCLTDEPGRTVDGDGSVWNSVALSETFRGRVDETGFLIHQLTAMHPGVLSTREVVAREVGRVRWHFQ
jgi:hypothetical protein